MSTTDRLPYGHSAASSFKEPAMGKNPLNLALRFALELTSLFAPGYWGFTQFDGVLRWLIGPGAPLIAATLWGTFRVDYEPKKAPVRVPGIVRLGIEILVLG